MKHLLVLLLFLALLGVGTAADNKTKIAFQQEAVKRGSFTPIVSARGTLEPDEVVDIGAQVSGIVQRLGADPTDKSKTVDFNSLVKKGMVLAQIDPLRYEADLNVAKADLQVAEAALEKAKVKVDQMQRALQKIKKRQADKVATADEVEAAQDALELAKTAVPIAEAKIVRAKAALEQAKMNLEYTTVRSPVDGIIIDRRVEVGQTVQASLSAPSLFLVAAGGLNKLQVWAQVPEADSATVTEGQAATCTVAAFPKATWKGRVTQIRLNAVDRDRRAPVFYTVVIELNADNGKHKLLPYLTANATIALAERKDVLLVPNAALRWRPRLKHVPGVDPLDMLKWARPESTMVWVEEDGVLRRIPVETGKSDGNFTEILTGDLKEGTKVVTGVVGEPADEPVK